MSNTVSEAATLEHMRTALEQAQADNAALYTVKASLITERDGLRAALDAEREHSAKLEAALIRSNKYGQQADTDLTRERWRSVVLSAEVRAWRDGNEQHDFLGWCRDNGDTDNHYTIMGAKDRTDRTNALDRENFKPEQQ